MPATLFSWGTRGVCSARHQTEHAPIPLPTAPEPSVSFGPFRLIPAQQLLLEGDAPVALGARALGVLIALVEHAGEVISNQDLISRVWPGTFVEESNLRVHIAGLRRVLRDGQDGRRFVVNVPGRGYSFVAPVRSADAPAAPSRSSPVPIIDLPAMPVRMIGRDAAVAALRTLLFEHRFVTLVGPGGIGKTTVALAMARGVLPAYRDGAAFIDLGAVRDAQLLPGTLAATLGLAVPADDAIPAVVAFLRQRHMLLLLDNCEHVIETAAEAAERIVAEAPGVHLLATSREPLRAAGERVYRLPPLDNPPDSAGLSAAAALRFPGVQLFVERAAAVLAGFTLSDADAPFAAEICRRLDGIALAIEFAAGRVAAFGVRDLAARLDDRFTLLTSGRRTALPRHQTLAATLDWSYGLLDASARRLLRHLAVFAGDFSADAASAMSEAPETGQGTVELAELVSKSLVVAMLGDGPTRFRLLDTTRLYGLEKLRKAGELDAARRRHAEYVRDRLAAAEADCDRLPPRDWLALYGRELDNVRLALDWADEAGDAAVLVVLTVRAVPLWVQLSLMSECRRRAARALERIDTAGEGTEAKRQRMQLLAALGWALMYGAGRSDETGKAWAAALRLAEEMEDEGYRLRALWGSWMGEINQGNWATGLGLARRIMEAAERRDDPHDRMMADRLLATTMHYLGDQRTALRHIERMLRQYEETARQPRVVRFQVDQKVTAGYFHARMLWLLGLFDQARHAVDANVAEGRAQGNPLSFASVLGQGACPTALFTGDLVAARRFGAMLLEHAERHQFALWHDWANCFEGAVTAREGDVGTGVRLMRAALDRLGERRNLPRYMILLGELSASLGQVGEVTPGLRMIEDLIARCERTGERWYLPEALRIRAELLLRAGSGAIAVHDTEALLMHAGELASAQGAHAWRLRVGLSLAGLRRTAGQDEEARAGLDRIVRDFTEGFETADLRIARLFLAG